MSRHSTPALSAAEKVIASLRKEEYSKLQFVPFRDHLHEFRISRLPSLVEHEQRILAAVRAGEPILYEYSLCREYHLKAQDVTPRQELLAELFLFNRSLPHDVIRGELSEYAPHLESDGKGGLRFPLRIVPLFDLLITADPLDCEDEDRIHLFRDSVVFANHVRNRLSPECAPGEIGLGSGLISLIAAQRSASRVIGVDINPRAVDFAWFNARVNGLEERVSFELGSDADLLARPDVDTVLSNPPFMLLESSDRSLCSYGGGRYGLDIALRIVEGCHRTGRRLHMIISGPDAGLGNEFERALPREALWSQRVERTDLDARFASHRPWLQAGCRSRELAVYEL